MSVILVNEVKSQVSDELMLQAASRYGQPEAQVKKVVDAGIPTLLAFFLDRAETAEGANTVHKLATEAVGGGNAGLFLEKGNPVAINIMTVLNRLFHDRWTTASRMIAEYSGIRSVAAQELLAWLAPATLSVLGRQIKQDNLSAPQLAGVLLSQKEAIVHAIPPGFNLAGALGLSSVGSLGLGAANMSSGVKKPTDTLVTAAEPAAKGPNKWIFPLLVGVAVLILVWYFLNR